MGALVVCMFRGFLRVGEVRCLRKTDILRDVSDFSLHISKSKTDQHSKGASVRFTLPPSSQEFQLLTVHMNNIDLSPSCYLFPSCSTKRPLSQATISSKLRNLFRRVGLQDKGYSTHSFRGGAASAALEQGIDSSRVMSAGRWRSSKSFQAYIRPLM